MRFLRSLPPSSGTICRPKTPYVNSRGQLSRPDTPVEMRSVVLTST